VLFPTPIEVKEDQTIILSRSFSFVATNNTAGSIEIKSTTPGAANFTLGSGDEKTCVAPKGSIYTASDPSGKRLLFIDEANMVSLKQIVVDPRHEVQRCCAAFDCVPQSSQGTGGPFQQLLDSNGDID